MPADRSSGFGDEKAPDVQAMVRRGGFNASAGRLPSLVTSNRTLVIARLRGQRDLRIALKRLGEFLSNPETPVDDLYLRAVGLLADRVGLPRVMLQGIESRNSSEVSVVNLTSSDVERAIEKVRSNPGDFVVRPIDADVLKSQAEEIAAAKAEVDRRTAGLAAAKATLHEGLETRPIPPAAEEGDG